MTTLQYKLHQPWGSTAMARMLKLQKLVCWAQYGMGDSLVGSGIDCKIILSVTPMTKTDNM